ncbi:hypothetical protein HK097_008722 [Rhizophlyctis rosea]|uniref:PH domain-containing protein n=1 Tax=Rhizophlyctis rosea TaxID=64517 RepID=A0AAD5SL37_9FUNG|nr:hypothetical protein HK097_008722 [Rhizophlyctis rosea]
MYPEDFDYDEDEYAGSMEPPNACYISPHYRSRSSLDGSNQPYPTPNSPDLHSYPPAPSMSIPLPPPRPVSMQLPTSAPSHCGFIKKLSFTRTFHTKTWKPRFCVLVDSTLYLFRSDAPSESSVAAFPITERSLAFVSEEGMWVLEIRDERTVSNNASALLPESLAALVDAQQTDSAPPGNGSDNPEEKTWHLQCPDKESMMLWLDALRMTISNLKAGVAALPQLKYKYSRPLNSIPGFGLPSVDGMNSSQSSLTGQQQQQRPASPEQMIASFRRLSLTVSPPVPASAQQSAQPPEPSTASNRLSIWPSMSSQSHNSSLKSTKQEKQAAKEEEKERKKREKEEKEKMKKMRFPYVTALDLLPPDMREEVLNMKI